MNAPAQISIAGRPIGTAHPPYVIAEMSANHNGSLDRAFDLLAAAHAAGADAVKLQSYRADTITLDCDDESFVIQGGLWSGQRLYDLYRDAQMPWAWHRPLFDRARELGVTLFSSPFDHTAIDLLEDLNAPAYKIASFEAVDLPLIRYAAGTRKPLIISTGMANADEIGEAVAAARDGGCSELVLLHCVSGYPAAPEEYNLRTIPDLIARHRLVTGLSDHTLDNTTAIASVALGAAVIEKHFTLDRASGGPDAAFSLEPPELAALCTGVRTAWAALGRVDYGLQSSERGNAQYRRSLYFVRDLKAGELIDATAVRSVRPGFGLPPKYLPQVIGQRVRHDIQRHAPVRAADLEHAPESLT